MKHSNIHFAILLAIILATFLPSNGLGDTGTYRIEDYTVTLTPRNNGYVEIDYYQKWKVTGGNIPWITVGMANSTYSIVHEKTGKNISQIQTNNSRSWSGVHIALDKKYQAGESFEVKFTVIQNRLFQVKGEKYRLHFIPGWYDRANINRLGITLNCFADLGNVTAKPGPDRIGNRTFSWEKKGLKGGAKFSIRVDFPKSFFPGDISLAKVKKSSKGTPLGPGFFIFIVFLIFIIIIIAASASSRKNNYGSGGNIRTGGAKAGIHRPGCVVSCACACVSCACACACAGGGAAGCDRKLTVACPSCKTCENEACPVGSKNAKGRLMNI